MIADRQGFVWVGGTAPQDSILKFTRDGKFVSDFGHRPPAGTQLPENNQQTDLLVARAFQIDEVARESTSSTGSACSCTTWTLASSSEAGVATACR